MRLPLQFPSEQRPQAIIKRCPEDFQVTELHHQVPGSIGDFAVLEVLKRDLTTPVLLRHLAEYFEIARESLGCAGYKDRTALTRQRLTLPSQCWGKARPNLPEILEWRWLGRQDSPLRPGHLVGNHFEIRLRQVESGAWLEKAWERQQPVGFANYYGVQRFGPDAERWQQGMEMLRHPPPRRQCRRWPHNFELIAAQSHLFNDFLNNRVQAGRFQVVRNGDWVLSLSGDSALRIGDSARRSDGGAQDRAALAKFSLLPLGPVWGYKLESPSLEEREILQKWELKPESFRPFRAPGSRRPLRLPLPTLDWRAEGADLWLCFQLPPGSYATILLEHFFQLRVPGT